MNIWQETLRNKRVVQTAQDYGTQESIRCRRTCAEIETLQTWRKTKPPLLPAWGVRLTAAIVGVYYQQQRSPPVNDHEMASWPVSSVRSTDLKVGVSNSSMTRHTKTKPTTPLGMRVYLTR